MISMEINTKMLGSESYYPARGHQIRGNTQNVVHGLDHYELIELHFSCVNEFYLLFRFHKNPIFFI